MQICLWLAKLTFKSESKIKAFSDMPELKVYHLDYFSKKNKTWVGTPAKQKYSKEDFGFKNL